MRTLTEPFLYKTQPRTLSMASLPRIIDIRDDLEQAQSASENDIEEDVSDVLSQLEQYSDPDRRHQVGLLDTAENTLLRLQEQEGSEKATRRLQAARNRIEIFRNAISDTATELVVVDSEIRDSNADSEMRVERLQEEIGEARVSVVNLGEPTDGLVEVSFYDDDGMSLGNTVTTIALDSDEERTVTLDVEVPADTVHYTAIAREETT